MKRFFVLALLFALPFTASAQTFQWTGVINDGYRVTFGTVSDAPAGATTVVAAATVTEIIPIPADAEYASITIRSGTASANITHVTAVAGNISQASFAVALFPDYESALFYRNNHATLGNPPAFYVTTSSGAYQANSASLFQAYGTTEIPVGRNRYLILWITPVNDAYINSHGLTVRVRFGR